MDVTNSQLFLYDSNVSSDIMMIEETKLLKQLEEEAVHCSKNAHTEDELTAAIGMMLMHYQSVVEPQNTPKNKPIHCAPAVHSNLQSRNATNPQSIAESLQGVQNIHTDTTKQQNRKNRKSNSSKSSLLASCRNILKEFLSQNSI